MSRRDRLTAVAITLGLHAVLGWGAAKLLAPAPLAAPRADAPMELLWVAAPPLATNVAPARRANDADATAAPTASVRPINAALPALPVAKPPGPPPAPTPTPTPTLSVIAREDAPAATAPPPPGLTADLARDAIRDQAPIAFAERDPSARRTVRLPGAGSERFRMREPRSPAAVVSSIGRLFAGGNYEANPCAELKKDVRDLARDGDSAAFQDALYYERRACH